MVQSRFFCAIAVLAAHVQSSLLIPLFWAKTETRLSITVSVQDASGTYHASTSRLDMGSNVQLTLPYTGCELQDRYGGRCKSCSGSMSGQCLCAPSTSRLMPTKCPSGVSCRQAYLVTGTNASLSSTSREYCTCPTQTYVMKIGDVAFSELIAFQYLESAEAGCSASNPANTGFGYSGNFLRALGNTYGRISSLSLPNLAWTVGVSKPSSYIAATPWSQYYVDTNGTNHRKSGRSVHITHVNGKAVSSVYATIDTGNSNFLSYCDPNEYNAWCNSRSPLSAVSALAIGGTFSMTFAGGDTVTFSGRVKMPSNLSFRASSYNHNVLSLGFLNQFQTVYLDDSGGTSGNVYFK